MVVPLMVVPRGIGRVTSKPRGTGQEQVKVVFSVGP
jgi:hypothetical protein